MIPELLPYAQFVAQFALIAAATFAGIQFLLHRREVQHEAALAVLTRLQTPEFRAAYTRIWELPLGCPADHVRAKGPEMEEAVDVVMFTFESLGVMVHNRIVPIELVDQVIGGFLRESWRRVGPYVEWKRKQVGSRRWAEWYEWLADRLGVDKRRVRGAYEVFANWKA
ncbi:MAG: DUF4760 domain-containing protein [Thermoplasmatota archaeon]